MSQLKAKQIKLAAAGDILIGGVGGTGTVVGVAGNTGKVLRVVGSAPTWSLNDNVASANTFNAVTATDGTGVTVAVQNAGGTAKVDLAKFNTGTGTDETFEFSNSTGSIQIEATGTETDIDIVLTPKGSGEVIFGGTGGAALQAEDGENISLLGGTGAGNVFISGGASGKVYYGGDATDANKEVATVGAISSAVSAATNYPKRKQYAGDAPAFTLDAGAVANSIEVAVNGLVLKSETFTYATGAITFNTGALGYTLDSVDQVVILYNSTNNL
jgi:hypothetical protein